MSSINLLYKDSIALDEHINIMIPTVESVLESEDLYYGLVAQLTASPIDLMVQLDDLGIDFTSIDDYGLFVLLFRGLQAQDTSLIFGDLNLSDFEMGVSEDSHDVAFINSATGAIINRTIYNKIATTLRKIHHLERDRRKPGNEEAKKYMLERARVKQRRNSRRKRVSQLESLIVSMVNTEQFKYDFDGVRRLSIYQFNESVRQVIHKVEYDNRMIGVYTGNISSKDLSQDDLNWLCN